MITVELNSVDISSKIEWRSLRVRQNLTNQGDTASFTIKQPSSIPSFDDDIIIYDGATKIFAGKISDVSRETETIDREIYSVSCVDHTFEMDRILASRIYENKTIKYIIDDLIASFAPSFTTANVSSTFLIQKIVFNQVPLSQCLRKLSDIVQYNWYVDEEKDVHFFSKFTNSAPFDLTDTNGNYVYQSLDRSEDGSQVVNRVKVRGGEYDGEAYTDTITVKGNDQKSFLLPYKMANLVIEVDIGAGFVSKTVGIDFIDTFATVDVLYNYQTQSFKFENALLDGNKIKFTGNPKTPVLAIAEDPDSIVKYGVIEKLIRDNSIASNQVGRRRASGELLAFAETIVDATFQTNTQGLKSGMVINIKSVNRNFDDNLIIKSITFSAIDPNNFKYTVNCISTKRYDLIDLLRKIITPEPLQADENEVAEQIFAINETINTLDEVEMINPYFPEENVSVNDEAFLDPVDPGDLEWVYGFYSPNDVDDPKRMGRYDRGAWYS